VDMLPFFLSDLIVRNDFPNFIRERSFETLCPRVAVLDAVQVIPIRS